MTKSKFPFGFLSAILITISFFTYLGMNIDKKGLFFIHNSTDEIIPILNTFLQRNRPLVEINLSALYNDNSQFQILHPILNMSHLIFREENPTCTDLEESSNNRPTQMSHGFIERLIEKSENHQILQKKQLNFKSEVLEQFFKGESLLTDDFILTPPFIDDWGNSFAFLLTQRGSSKYNDKKWVEKHLSFFKIAELRTVLNKYQINDIRYWTLSRLSETEIEDLIKADPLVMTNDYLFLKNQSKFGFSPLSYWVYYLRDFRTELKNTNYELSPFNLDSVCLVKMGNGCWTYSSTHTMNYLYKYSMVIIALVGFIFLLFLIFFFRHLNHKMRTQNKNRLALQVLSHEFRTPVSSMILMLEQISKKSVQYEIQEQDLLTRISTEVFRLQRIIEISKNYLQTDSHRIHFNIMNIESVNNWFLDLTAELPPSLHLVLLPVDQSLKADPFWLKFIISNLVQNAFAHGKPPVVLRINLLFGKIKISIEDHGHCEFSTLNQMTDAFMKSQRSKGMGLGLNIVKFILDDWGVEIKFSTQPTTFSLFFKPLNKVSLHG